MTVDHNL